MLVCALLGGWVGGWGGGAMLHADRVDKTDCSVLMVSMNSLLDRKD